MGLGCAKTKADLVATRSGRQIFIFFALRMTTGPKILGTVILRGVFTQPVSNCEVATCPRDVRSSPNCGHGWPGFSGAKCSPLPPDQFVDGFDDRLGLAAFCPRQIAALVQPVARVVCEHSGKQSAGDSPRLVTILMRKKPTADHRADCPLEYRWGSRRNLCWTPSMTCLST